MCLEENIDGNMFECVRFEKSFVSLLEEIGMLL